MSKLEVVYIAGPYRGKTICETVENIRRAEMVAKLVWKNGGIALCPHLNSALFDGLVPDDQFLAGGLELLRRCDMVMLVQGWEQSNGTLAEIEEAKRLNIPVIGWKEVE